jgi:hypothetical protein
VPSTVLQLMQGGNGIPSYAGVGFQQNQVAILQAQVNGAPDTNPSDFQVQINWGNGVSTGELAPDGTVGSFAQFIVKGSNTYQQPTSGTNSIPITVSVTGPGGVTQSAVTDSASVQSMPSFIPGTPPAPVTPSAPPENVFMLMSFAAGVFNTAGVPIQATPVASLQVQVNGALDTNAGDFHAQINWGDSGLWTTGEVVFQGVSGQYAAYQVLGSHTYYKANNDYPVVVYVTGPDGTSASGWEANAPVGPNPAQAILAANFAGSGVWVYRIGNEPINNSWEQIDHVTAQNLVLAPDGSVLAGFGSAGLWRWTAATSSWLELSPGNAQSIAVDNNDVVAGFGNAGLWRWTVAAG